MLVPTNSGATATEVLASSSPAQQHVELTPSEARRTRCGAYQCLILSGDNRRRAMLNRAAEIAGWEPILCLDSDAANERINRMFLQLAIVDLVTLRGREPRGYRTIAEKLARMGRLLLVICGNEDRPQEEIWARQLGAWLYLPGEVESDDVAVLCGEARNIAEQLAAPVRAAQTNGVSANGSANGHANGSGNGHTNGSGHGYPNGSHVNGSANGHVNGNGNGHHANGNGHASIQKPRNPLS